MELNNLEDITYKLDRHKKTPEESLYEVRWHEQDIDDDTMQPVASDQKHFLTRNWLSKNGKPNNNLSTWKRRIFIKEKDTQISCKNSPNSRKGHESKIIEK